MHAYYEIQDWPSNVIFKNHNLDRCKEKWEPRTHLITSFQVTRNAGILTWKKGQKMGDNIEFIHNVTLCLVISLTL
jgi:hypothetical protein